MRFTRLLLQKTTTGLYGIDVVPNAKSAYSSLLKRIIHLTERFPKTSVYATSTAALAKQRLEIVETPNLEISQIEEKINNGQIEELIIQAEDEISLLPKMLEWKPWETTKI